jgi:hypothetical protein
MRCSGVRLKIDEYLDGGLSAKVRDKIEKHISECCECRDHIEITKKILKAAPDLIVPESTPNWESLSIKIRGIIIGKKTSPLKQAGINIPGFATKFSPGRLIPIYSAVSVIIIFGLFVSLFAFLMSSSELIANKDDRFLMRQIEAAENIYKANLKVLKEELISVENSLPADVITAIAKANKDVEDEISKCSRLVQIYPSERVIVNKLFESYKMQIKLHKDLIINIKSQEV